MIGPASDRLRVTDYSIGVPRLSARLPAIHAHSPKNTTTRNVPTAAGVSSDMGAASGVLRFQPCKLLIGNLILCIMAGMKAKEGVEYRYPFALRLIK